MSRIVTGQLPPSPTLLKPRKSIEKRAPYGEILHDVGLANLSILHRLHSSQRCDAIHHILESLLVLLCRVRSSFGALDFLSVIPLNLEGRQDDTGVEAVDVLAGVCRQTF